MEYKLPEKGIIQLTPGEEIEAALMRIESSTVREIFLTQNFNPFFPLIPIFNFFWIYFNRKGILPQKLPESKKI